MINETTANYIASALRHAAARVNLGRTLKEALARVEAELHTEVDGVDAEECRKVWDSLKGTTRKERFVTLCLKLANEYSAEAARACTRRRADHLVNRARKDGYIIPGSVALDVVLRTEKAEGWSYSEALALFKSELGEGWSYSEALALFKSELGEVATRRVAESIKGQADDAIPPAPAAEEESPAPRQGKGWAIVNGPRQVGVVGVLMLQGKRVGAVTWSTAYTPHLFRVQLADQTHGFNERHAALDWAAARLAYLAGDDCAANDPRQIMLDDWRRNNPAIAAIWEAGKKPAPKVEEYRTAVLSTAHMMPRDWDLLAEQAIDTATDNGLFWVHDTPCGSILRFKASHNWREELTELGASVMLITTINAMETLGFDAVHFDRDADTVEGLDTCEEVDA